MLARSSTGSRKKRRCRCGVPRRPRLQFSRHPSTPRGSVDYWAHAEPGTPPRRPKPASAVRGGAEREMLRQWVLNDRCRLVAILGLGGIGKTQLATRVAQDVASTFDFV